MSTELNTAIWIAVTLSLLAPRLPASEAGSMSVPVEPPSPSPPPLGPPGGPDSAFDSFLRTDIPPADGFDFPVGDPDGWGDYPDARDGRPRTGFSVYIRFGQWYSYGIHPGEDWNGCGQGNSDEGQPVYAVAAGRVVLAEPDLRPAGGVVIVQHVFYENDRKRRIRSVYKHLTDLRVETGQLVERRQRLGSIGRGSDDRYLAHLHLELRWDESLGPTFWPSAHHKSRAWIEQHFAPPSAFIRGHRQLFVPQREDHLVLIHTPSHRLRLYERGRPLQEIDVGYGRPSGERERAAFDRPRRGMYFVVGRRRGRLELNYPNAFDAAAGRALGLVLPRHEARIRSAWLSRRPTLQTTLLGRGLGFTGRLAEWEPGLAPTATWGSLLLRRRDFRRLYDHVPLGAMVIIF